MQFGSPEFFEFLLGCFAVILAICALVIFWVREFRERKNKEQEIASKTICYFVEAWDGFIIVYSETGKELITLPADFSYQFLSSKTSGALIIRISFSYLGNKNNDVFFIHHKDTYTLKLIKNLSKSK
ncbi:TPA: hypothetical protein DCZ46_03570 [Candidatus Campbellbacteria bacterium]|nr:MAG: hypothetical protein UR74_C0002G0056 [Candidatus Campbellbacteria bacterium GW2011_GWD2_35_24]KKP75676.1 MAG: hypothetical protein UR75_C0002G0057 [Candidatus Campbellbacteria bacterium GW2011_GWC2_35_28]KKP77076.1 MAG: hypothetical protein UR76_C0002G0277 [Candidatus Campbellbacteria bacterium GW2011_GWC1_35_31]KKP79002.1 MAG: hypothetical protein UR79_C0002G0277 [Candidatus Campbellbacteria bacterium GW2011_GWD1_35_49]HAP74079.1 hypothetical protein [Candidatus Campbellbacteria bacter